MIEQRFAGDPGAFRKKHLEENPQDIITLRLNPEERIMVTELKRMLHEDKDGTVIKKCLELSHNVFKNTFGEKLMGWLTVSRRMRSGPK